MSEDFRVHKMSDGLHKNTMCSLIHCDSTIFYCDTSRVCIYKSRGMRIASGASLLMFLLMKTLQQLERIAIRLLMLLLQLLTSRARELFQSNSYVMSIQIVETLTLNV